jgi:glycosyltransferase involved in cell wall biosynthesis
VVVVPLAVARGIQNKVLEAMAMAKPVVATPQVLAGIPARHGVHVLEAERTPDAFAAAIEAALAPDGANIARSARTLVAERFSWDAQLAGLPALLGQA